MIFRRLLAILNLIVGSVLLVGTGVFYETYEMLVFLTFPLGLILLLTGIFLYHLKN